MLVYWIWFSQLRQLSCAQKWQLLQHFRDPEEIYHSEESAFEEFEFSEEVRSGLEDKDLTAARQILEECQNKGIHLLTVRDEAYPHRLRNTYDPPILLYFKGTLPDWNSIPAIGVVGTRKATSYGCSTAHKFGAQIAACGALVVSGAAAGIDAMAMRGALDAGKPTVAVLGTGVDVVYPKKNHQLFEDTLRAGCLISEYPPRTEGLGWHFPQRNRIISGMCNGLLVVEAPEKSGALITARLALEQGRDVFVVPGNVDSPSCEGSNALLQERAVAALSGWDVVKEYASIYPQQIAKRSIPQNCLQVAQTPLVPEFSPAESSPADKKSIDKRDKSSYSVVDKPAPVLTPQEEAVLERVGEEPRFIDDILEEDDLPAGTVKAILTRLVIKGVIQNHPGGRVSRK